MHCCKVPMAWYVVCNWALMLHFWLQSLSLGLGEQWEQVKAAYAQANRALGDIVKVSIASL